MINKEARGFHMVILTVVFFNIERIGSAHGLRTEVKFNLSFSSVKAGEVIEVLFFIPFYLSGFNWKGWGFPNLPLVKFSSVIHLTLNEKGWITLIIFGKHCKYNSLYISMIVGFKCTWDAQGPIIYHIMYCML